MARPKKPTDDKTQSLKKYGALNPRPHKVAEKMFSDSQLEFFDPPEGYLKKILSKNKKSSIL